LKEQENLLLGRVERKAVVTTTTSCEHMMAPMELQQTATLSFIVIVNVKASP
jgi:hypothetical protein